MFPKRITRARIKRFKFIKVVSSKIYGNPGKWDTGQKYDARGSVIGLGNSSHGFGSGRVGSAYFTGQVYVGFR
jgi:hypothetical protein